MKLTFFGVLLDVILGRSVRDPGLDEDLPTPAEIRLMALRDEEDARRRAQRYRERHGDS